MITRSQLPSPLHVRSLFTNHKVKALYSFEEAFQSAECGTKKKKRKAQIATPATHDSNSTWNWGLSEVANLRPHDADDGRASCHCESLAELNEGLGYCVVRGYM